MESNRPRSAITLPGAIIISAALVAIAIIWVKKPISTPITQTAPTTDTAQVATVQMAPVTSDDHILGNPNAPIKIIEYSDPSCPFCKMFNPVMEQIMTQYGPGGKVAWIYRSFPLDVPDQNGNVLHPNAGQEAGALECAASLGGNTKFWAYEKEWYQVIPDNGAERSSAEDQKQILQVAKDNGLNLASFNDCLSSGQFKSKINSQYVDGINAGANGTPFMIVITPSGSKMSLVGSQSLATMQSTIQTLLTETN